MNILEIDVEVQEVIFNLVYILKLKVMSLQFIVVMLWVVLHWKTPYLKPNRGFFTPKKPTSKPR